MSRQGRNSGYLEPAPRQHVNIDPAATGSDGYLEPISGSTDYIEQTPGSDYIEPTSNVDGYVEPASKTDGYVEPDSRSYRYIEPVGTGTTGDDHYLSMGVVTRNQNSGTNYISPRPPSYESVIGEYSYEEISADTMRNQYGSLAAQRNEDPPDYTPLASSIQTAVRTGNVQQLKVVEVQPQSQLAVVTQPVRSPQTFIGAIVCSVFASCLCLPLGIPALILAIMAGSYVREEKQDLAKSYIRISYILSVVGILIVAIPIIVIVILMSKALNP